MRVCYILFKATSKTTTIPNTIINQNSVVPPPMVSTGAILFCYTKFLFSFGCLEEILYNKLEYSGSSAS